MAATLFDYTIMPLLLPLLVAWWMFAFGAAWMLTFTVVPSVS